MKLSQIILSSEHLTEADIRDLAKKLNEPITRELVENDTFGYFKQIRPHIYENHNKQRIQFTGDIVWFKKDNRMRKVVVLEDLIDDLVINF